MAIRVKMTIGLKDDVGVSFGTLEKVSDRHLQVEIDAEYHKGQMLEFQFALEGWRTSVQGEVAVVRVVPHQMPHGPTTYALKIVSIGDGKETTYREWLYEIAQGGGGGGGPPPPAPPPGPPRRGPAPRSRLLGHLERLPRLPSRRG